MPVSADNKYADANLRLLVLEIFEEALPFPAAAPLSKPYDAVSFPVGQGRKRGRNLAAKNNLHFDVSTGLKRVLGRELITDDEVAIFELVKNSFDAGADSVQLYFGDGMIVIADNGSGMSYEDLTDKWLFVAYSSKRTDRPEDDFRNLAAERRHYAGSKGIGRFSSDRLGEAVILQSRPKGRTNTVHRLTVDWELFEKDAKEHFEKVPVRYAEQDAFELPHKLRKFESTLKHGTVVTIQRLRRPWPRQRILDLKASLAKLINPFGEETDGFSIHITAPAEAAEDERVIALHAKKGEEPLPRDIVNGQIGNFIFTTLQDKTTFIRVTIEGEDLNTTLTDRGEIIYRIVEPNPYRQLAEAGFRCEIYYLNQSAKATFTRRVGLPPIQFGSVFLFRNSFRVYPVGEDGDDWFGFNRRKQQGYSRFLGSREIIGRVDVSGSDEDFQEASSRNQGLIDTPAVKQLREAFLEHCLKRLEKYVVPVSWKDAADGSTDNLSRLMTDSGRARVTAAVANLVDNDNIRLIEYSKQLIDLINERSSDFEASLVSLRAIAEKTGDKKMLMRLDEAERRFDDLKKSEADARRVADKALAAAQTATLRAETAEAEVETERRRAHFLESFVNVDTATILNLHHQVTIYAVDIAQQIENFLTETAGKTSVPRDTILKTLEQMAFLNRKVMSVTKFAAKANFKLDSEKIETNLAAFIYDYIEQIARTTGSARLQITAENTHPGIKLRFNPIDTSIIVDNLISNARKAKATRIKFVLAQENKSGLTIRVTDNGRGLTPGTNRSRIFEMGYTTTQGSGLGLYHVRQALGEMGGSIELDDQVEKGLGLVIKIAAKGGKA
jgi:signal transduction histidine kinase